MTAESSAGGTQALTLVQALAAMMAGARDHGLPARGPGERPAARPGHPRDLHRGQQPAHLGGHPTVRARPGGCP